MKTVSGGPIDYLLNGATWKLVVAFVAYSVAVSYLCWILPFYVLTWVIAIIAVAGSTALVVVALVVPALDRRLNEQLADECARDLDAGQTLTWDDLADRYRRLTKRMVGVEGTLMGAEGRAVAAAIWRKRRELAPDRAWTRRFRDLCRSLPTRLARSIVADLAGLAGVLTTVGYAGLLIGFRKAPHREELRLLLMYSFMSGPLLSFMLIRFGITVAAGGLHYLRVQRSVSVAEPR